MHRGVPRRSSLNVIISGFFFSFWNAFQFFLKIYLNSVEFHLWLWSWLLFHIIILLTSIASLVCKIDKIIKN